METAVILDSLVEISAERSPLGHTSQPHRLAVSPEEDEQDGRNANWQDNDKHSVLPTKRSALVAVRVMYAELTPHRHPSTLR